MAGSSLSERRRAFHQAVYARQFACRTCIDRLPGRKCVSRQSELIPIGKHSLRGRGQTRLGKLGEIAAGFLNGLLDQFPNGGCRSKLDSFFAGASGHCSELGCRLSGQCTAGGGTCQRRVVQGFRDENVTAVTRERKCKVHLTYCKVYFTFIAHQSTGTTAMNTLSFHEKSAIVTLIATWFIGVFYFHSVWDLWQAGQLHPGSMTGLATGLVVLLVIVLVGYHILIALTARPEKEDERDKRIAMRAGNIGGVVLKVGVIGIVGHILIGGFFDDPVATSPMLIANALMAVVFVATIIELIITLVFYRRGV